MGDVTISTFAHGADRVTHTIPQQLLEVGVPVNRIAEGQNVQVRQLGAHSQ
jgi:hypothetical protein